MRNCTKRGAAALAMISSIAWVSLSVVIAVTLHAAPVNAKQSYLVDVGDVLQISVARIPELTGRARIEADGTISYPLLGTIQAAQQPMELLREKIKAGLAGKVFWVRTDDRRGNALVIEADEVSAFVAEYRPVYVTGDVLKPGSYSFRPGLSVRQATALAGGYSLLRAGKVGERIDRVALKEEYESLWADFASEQARLWVSEAELAGEKRLDKSFVGLPLPSAMLDRIVMLARRQLQASTHAYEREEVFLKQSIKTADEQITVAREQLEKETQRQANDEKILVRTQQLLQRGTLVNQRLEVAQRAAMNSASRRLQVAAQLIDIQRSRAEFARRLERLEEDRRMRALRETKDATSKLATVRAKLNAVGHKLGAFGARAAASGQSGVATEVELVIFRKLADRDTRIDATADRELLPGDTLEVKLALPHLDTFGVR